MKPLRTIALLLTLTIFSAVSLQAVISTWTGAVDDDFQNSGNWSAGVPGSSGVADVATLGGEGGPLSSVTNTTLYATNTTTYPSGFIDLNMRNNTTFINTFSFRTIRKFELGSAVAGGNAVLDNTFDHRVGQLNIRDELNIGDDNTHTKTDTFILRNSSILLFSGAAGSKSVTVNDTGVFHLIGESVTATIGDGTLGVDAQFIMNDTAELKYTLGTAAASILDIEAGFTVGANSLLTIDAAAYTGGATSIALANYLSRTGSFALANVSILNLDPSLTGSISYDADSMDLILTAVPEPSTFALMAGFAALGLVYLRRRRLAS